MPDSVREIEHLLYSYAERIDAGDLGGVGELFRHGRIVAGGTVVAEGREAVSRLYERTTRLHEDGTPRTRHVTTNVTVEVDDATGTAHARAYYTVLQQTAAIPLQVIIAGRYHDTFRRNDDGRWHFDRREIFVDLTGDLSQHLLIEL